MNEEIQENRDPDTLKTIDRMCRELNLDFNDVINSNKGSDHFLENANGRYISLSTVHTVINDERYKAFEKNNKDYRRKVLLTKQVPVEFAYVIDLKRLREPSTSGQIDFPTVSIYEGQREVYNQDGLQVIMGDSEIVLGSLGKVDVAITSPPYNIGVDYNTYNDKKKHEEYLEWIGVIASKLHNILDDMGSFFLNVGSTNKFPNIANEVCKAVLDKGFILQNDIVWVKSISVMPVDKEVNVLKDCLRKLGLKLADLKKIKPDIDFSLLREENTWKTFGHFKPINSARYLNHCHESIFHFTKNGEVPIDRLAVGVPYDDKSNIDRWNHNKSEEEGGKNRDRRCRGNVWHIPYKTVQETKEHPAGYPVELVENCIKLHGVRPGLRVLDPFLGAGTTLVACKNLKVSGIGIEADEYYCHLAKCRLSANS